VKVVYDAQAIQQAIERLAASIAADHAGKPLVLLGVLKGALYTTVDLARALSKRADGPSEIYVDYMCAASYHGTASSGEVRLLLDTRIDVRGRHVVLVDDIADNGLTMTRLRALLQEKGPASLRSCALFDKPARRVVDARLDYVGLTVPDAFVVGYGLDYQENYRTLPYLALFTNDDPSDGTPKT
jgi:hypoxanthine phosphoribosyltransferase